VALLYNIHDFYCCKCGRKGISLPRTGRVREKFHIKDLYCIHCEEVTKHIEIRFCDDELEVLDKLKEVQLEYYGGNYEV
jgi:hypothetical protein